MASTYTSSTRLEKQGDGENANTWGLRLNERTIDMVDDAIAGYATIALTTATEKTLTTNNGTADEARNFGLKFTGSFDSPVNVVIPAQEKIYFVHNANSGSGSVTMQPAGGTATTVAGPGNSAVIGTNGSTINVLETVTSVANSTDSVNASKVLVTTVSNSGNYRLIFKGANDTTGNSALFQDDGGNLNYNPSLNRLTVPNIRSSQMVSAADINATGTLVVDGTSTLKNVNCSVVVATGDVTAFSDERLKSKIKTLDGTRAFEMRGVSYEKDGKQGSGVIAQELEKIAPELINNSGEYKSVAYGNIVGYLIEAVKHLKEEVEELKGKVNGSS
tara:strand:- start:203 stop:1198 length:996 start_codon:yes stop_codon:yes gene_type:complete